MTSSVLGALGLVPAIILVVSGLTRAEIAPSWIHPVLLVSGLALCVAVQLPRVARARWAKTSEGGEATVQLRFAGREISWVELALAAALTVTIAGYQFLENFRPR